MNWKTTIVLISIFLSSCGIEIGNPKPSGGDGETKNNLQISVIKETNSFAKQFKLNIESVELQLKTESEEESTTALQLAESKVELLTDNDEENEAAITKESEVLVATYSGVRITLNSESPFEFTDREGNSRKVFFEDNTIRSFVVPQQISVFEGDAQKVLLDFDLRRAFRKAQENSEDFIFRPRSEVRKRKFALPYAGEVDAEDGAVVCAYLYDRVKLPFEKLPPPPPPGFPPPGPPPPFMGDESGKPRPGSFEVKRRPIFETKEDVIKDTTAECTNAFAIADVKDKKFKFDFLPPATYDFRLIKNDSSYEDLEEDVRLVSEEFTKFLEQIEQQISE